MVSDFCIHWFLPSSLFTTMIIVVLLYWVWVYISTLFHIASCYYAPGQADEGGGARQEAGGGGEEGEAGGDRPHPRVHLPADRAVQRPAAPWDHGLHVQWPRHAGRPRLPLQERQCQVWSSPPLKIFHDLLTEILQTPLQENSILLSTGGNKGWRGWKAQSQVNSFFTSLASYDSFQLTQEPEDPEEYHRHAEEGRGEEARQEDSVHDWRDQGCAQRVLHVLPQNQHQEEPWRGDLSGDVSIFII